MLVLDIGNTRIKWGYWQGGSLLWARSRTYGPDPGPQQLLQWLGDVDCTGGVFVGSVASDNLNGLLCHWFEGHCGCTPVFLRSRAEQVGVVNGYADPQRLGVDRWAGIIAAHAEYEGDVCVIDCGSAITLDVVDGAGQHLGGLIMPGLQMMRRALVKEAAGIPDEQGDSVALADNTGDAVSGGCLRLVAAGLTQMLSEQGRITDGPLRCVMTGGDGPVLGRHMHTDCTYDADLVLKGLALMAQAD